MPVVFQTPAPVEGSFAPTPAVSRSPAPAPVVEHFSPAPAVFHAPTDLPAHAGADVRGGGLQGSPQERVQQLVVELVSVVEVFRAIPQDRVQQHLVVMMFLSLQVGDA